MMDSHWICIAIIPIVTFTNKVIGDISAQVGQVGEDSMLYVEVEEAKLNNGSSILNCQRQWVAIPLVGNMKLKMMCRDIGYVWLPLLLCSDSARPPS